MADLLTHIWVTDTGERSVDEKMTAYYLEAEQAGEDVFRFQLQKMSCELMYRETFAESLCPDTVYDLIDYHPGVQEALRLDQGRANHQGRVLHLEQEGEREAG